MNCFFNLTSWKCNFCRIFCQVWTFLHSTVHQWHFLYCKQGSYRLWNSGKTMEFWKANSIYGKTMEFEPNGRTYGKTMEFLFWWKKVLSFFKKNGGKIIMSGLRNVVSMFFFASVITSLGLALRTSRAIALASAEWIPARQLTLFVS